MPNDDAERRIANLPTKSERKTIESADKARRQTDAMMQPSAPKGGALRRDNIDPTTKKQRFSRRKISTKRTLATATVDPEKLRAYFDRTKRDPNAANLKFQRSNPPIINHRLCDNDKTLGLDKGEQR